MENFKEEWREVQGYEGLYQISNLGRVKRGNRIKNNTVTPLNYQRTRLCKDGKVKNYFIHRLVAQAFIPNPNNYPIVNHKDENPSNNSVDNLEWCTVKYNTNYGTGIERRALLQRNQKATAKKVLQLSLNGEIIKEWPSTKEIERELKYCNPSISACCLGKYKTAYGYKWQYL